MDLIVRRPVADDVPAILEIINQAKLFLKECGVDQWQTDLPNEELIQNDIKCRSPFVFEANGKIAGYFCLAYGIEPTYVTPVSGEFTIPGDYATVHRTAVSNEFRGMGLSTRIFDVASEDCIKNNVHVLRVDTHKDNLRMRHIIEKNGFTECAIARMGDGTLRIAYEKRI